MRLSLHADYALRVLIYVGTRPDETVSTTTISETYGISKNHLVRVVQTSGEHGYLRVTPGRAGGITLARDPKEIRLGRVVQDVEPNLHLAGCFDEAEDTRPITRVCGLKSYLRDALNAFVAELNRHTLADLLAGGRRRSLARVLCQVVPAAGSSPAAAERRGPRARGQRA